MNPKYQELQTHLDNSKNILLTSHLSPDHDSIASMLLFKHILSIHYPSIQTDLYFENGWISSIDTLGEPLGDILTGEDIDEVLYDLVILVDVHELKRAFRYNRPYFETTPIIALDHHMFKDDEGLSLLIREEASSATELVYRIFKTILGDKLEIDDTIAKQVQVGILFDTNRFLWSAYPESYELMAKMSKVYPLNTEKVFFDSLAYPRNSIYIFNHILQNSKFKEDLVYSYIDDTSIEIPDGKYDYREGSAASRMFLDDISRTLRGVNWGFLVKGSSESDKDWRVMFRAIKDTHNVLPYLTELNGGGYPTAGSGTIQADSPQDAVDKVLQLIDRVDS